MPDLSEPLNEKNLQGYESVTRPRALTETSHASASTATPPKLLDSDLNFGEFDTGFSNMFDNFGDKKKKMLKGPGALDSSPFSPIVSTNCQVEKSKLLTITRSRLHLLPHDMHI